MKKRILRFLTMGLVSSIVLGSIVACANTSDDPNKESTLNTNENTNESEVVDPIQAELDALGTVDWGNEDFGVLYADGLGQEVVTDDVGAPEVLSSAVHERNTLFAERYHLKLTTIKKSGDDMVTTIQQEAQTGTGDFVLIENRMGQTAGLALQGLLYDYSELDVDLSKAWWDQGTADFAVNGHVYFMTGEMNFIDDNLTYALIFNKEMQVEFHIENPYDTVKNGKWTLDHFNNIIQGVAVENGNGSWGAEDTYGFAATREYGLTFFIGSDLRFVDNSLEQGLPTLSLTNRMEKASNVVDLSRKIYHGGATYMSPAGQEGNGLKMFTEGRTLFYGEVVEYLKTITQSSDKEFGVLPIPKYDEEQENYRTWTHSLGSCLSISAGVQGEQAGTVGKLVQAWAALSAQKVQPIYYNVLLTSRDVHDAESAEIIDTIFANRVYDMSLYYGSSIGYFSNSVKDAVNNDSNTFISAYNSVARTFERKIERLFKDMD